MKKKEGYHDEYGKTVRCYTCGKPKEECFRNQLEEVFDPFNEYNVQFVCMDCRVKHHGLLPEFTGTPKKVWIERGWEKE